MSNFNRTENLRVHTRWTKPLRHTLFLLTTLFTWASCAQTRAAQTSADITRPNIIVIVTDDQRWDMMGNVNPYLHTPVMDDLVRGGTRFDNAFVTTSICAASRASILTGMTERTHRYTFNTPPLAKRFIASAYPTRLRKAGYTTAYVGKFGVNVAASAPDEMYDHFVPLFRGPYWKKQPDGTLKHLTDIEGEEAIKFINGQKKNPGGAPFALTIGFNAPHAEDNDPQQYFWQKEVDHLYQDADPPKPALMDESFFDNTHPYLGENTMNRQRWYWRFQNDLRRKAMTLGYFKMISGVDLVIGRIRQALKANGQDKNTVIVLIGDNGYFLGERGYAGKWLPYEQSLRVPLVIYDPRVKKSGRGQKEDAYVLNIDVAPTVLDLAGVAPDEETQGKSLVPFVMGKRSDKGWRKDIWFEHLMMNPSIPKHEGVRNTRWKYIRYFEAQPMLEELYDLKNDPDEAVNLVRSPKYKNELSQLRARTDVLKEQYGGGFGVRTWTEDHSEAGGKVFKQ